MNVLLLVYSFGFTLFERELDCIDLSSKFVYNDGTRIYLQMVFGQHVFLEACCNPQSYLKLEPRQLASLNIPRLAVVGGGWKQSKLSLE